MRVPAWVIVLFSFPFLVDFSYMIYLYGAHPSLPPAAALQLIVSGTAATFLVLGGWVLHGDSVTLRIPMIRIGKKAKLEGHLQDAYDRLREISRAHNNFLPGPMREELDSQREQIEALIEALRREIGELQIGKERERTNRILEKGTK